MRDTTEHERALREALRATGAQAARIKSELDQLEFEGDINLLRRLRDYLPIRVIDLLTSSHTADPNHSFYCSDERPTGGLKVNRDGKLWFRCLRCALLDINAGRLPAAQKGGN